MRNPENVAIFVKVPIIADIAVTIDLMISNTEDPVPAILKKDFNSNMHLK